jgi:hypothetical protein
MQDNQKTKDILVESFIRNKINQIPSGNVEGLFKFYGGDVDNSTLVRVSVARKGESKSWALIVNDYMKQIRNGVSDEEFDYTRQGRVSQAGIEIYKDFGGVIWPEFEPMPTASAIDIQKTYQHNGVDLLSRSKAQKKDSNFA